MWRSYNMVLLFINYIIPLIVLAVTYSVVGHRLWGSQAIGEQIPGQAQTVRSKRRVRHCIVVCVCLTSDIAYLCVGCMLFGSCKTFVVVALLWSAS